MKFHVLIYDEQNSIPASVVKTITRFSYDTKRCSDMNKIFHLLEKYDPPILVSDPEKNFCNEIELLRKIQLHNPDLVIILFLNSDNYFKALKTLRFGRVEFIIKPVDMDFIQRILRNNFEIIKNKIENSRLNEVVKIHDPYHEYFKRDRSTAKMVSIIERIAKNVNNPVLIRGEQGTGKASTAKFIHLESSRKEKPFVSINCAYHTNFALSAELFGSENEKNKAGINRLKLGKLELADGGSLLIENIDRLPLNLQQRLLDFIRSKKFKRDGGKKEISTDVRIIGSSCLCSDNNEQQIVSGDLASEFSGAMITLPPLRLRKDLIPYFISIFVEEFSRRCEKKINKIDSSVFGFFNNLEWRGNIKELRATVELAVMLAKREELFAEDFYFIQTLNKNEENTPDELIIKLPLKGMEMNAVLKEVILKTLEIAKGNKTKTARILGITRSRLLYRIKQLGILDKKARK